jgi:PucR family transcriptional regulator, purine catabolism regulatory protein
VELPVTYDGEDLAWVATHCGLSAEEVVADTLGPVLALPEPERSDLLQTLDALLANNLNIAQTARQVHYHYNTLRYRLTKLEKLLGEFSRDAVTARRLGVALEILRMDDGQPR